MDHRFALAGDPIAHSLSPVMHRAALEAAGLHGTYALEPCDEEGFRSVVEALRSGEYSGLNVTMPHKRLAFSLCDRHTDEARLAGSVNTMRVDGAALLGHSSDVVAFRQIFAELGEDTPLVVLGSGGSARAAIAATNNEVLVSARDPSRMTDLRHSFGDRVMPLVGDVGGHVLINCTPLGMHGEDLPGELLESAVALVDLPYGSSETPAVADTRSRGIRVVDGIGFLARQAAVSFTWWTGVPTDLGTMTAAARNA